MHAHATQATAARQIAGIFGGNLGPLESTGTSTLALYRTGNPEAPAPAPAPGATPEQVAQHAAMQRQQEQAQVERSAGAFLTMAALGIAVGGNVAVWIGPKATLALGSLFVLFSPIIFTIGIRGVLRPASSATFVKANDV